MSKIQEEGKYIYRISKRESKKKYPISDLFLIPYKKYKKKGAKEMRLKFIEYSKKKKTLIFEITKRDHKFRN